MKDSKPARTVYLSNLSLKEAGEKWLSELAKQDLLAPLAGETVPVDDSLHRVTAEPVFALASSPHNHCAAMDGFAVRFTDTVNASEAEPLRLSLASQALPLDTGDPMPEGFDTVIMIEDVDPVSREEIEITSPATPWQHVRTVGEDIVATELVLPENQLIRPVDLAAMLAGGVTGVKVRPRPVVSIIPTGSELVQPGSELHRGDIIEFNSRLLAGMAAEWGARAVRHEIVPDDFEELKRTIADAAQNSHIAVINAGSSAGREDFTMHAIRELGEVLVHGVRIRPGKPVVLGVVDRTPVLGIPGYPVSAVLDMELFTRPLVYRLLGRSEPARRKVSARMPRKIASGLGAEEFVRVKVGKVGDNLVATPVERGAGALMSLVRADGLLRIPEDSEGVKADQTVTIELLKELDDVKNTIIVLGSHDISLDILASELRKSYPSLTLASAHVGSLGGLMALKRGEAHLAGTHLLDEKTGDYNISYIQRYLGDNVGLVNLVFRQQGLIIAAGNPKNIAGVEDLVRDDIIFINRQKGAGTRVLLDYKLKQSDIDAVDISGYEREEYTHMAVAAAVKDGAADAGLGILAAARALKLDFIAVATERYDLAIPDRHFDSDMIQALLSVIRTRGFQDRVMELGGYDTSQTGKLVGER
ncbi:molybdopterin molybdenumtransferase [bacterium BMS3Abin01]|nr:molybdopterin molybdenumtransferase [bacterium BMS3Abin01]